MKSDLLKIVAALQGSASVAILSHINPEGDAIGSTFNPDPVPKNLRGLPGAGEVIQADRLPRSFDCYLAVDATDPGRLGGLLSGVATGSLVINIDHHISNTRFGTYNWVDPEAAAAGEMIYHLIEEMFSFPRDCHQPLCRNPDRYRLLSLCQYHSTGSSRGGSAH
jgi:phosphoesterase RecJ-like protein